MRTLKIHIAFLFIIIIGSISAQDINKKFVRQNATAGGLNVKFMPAMYWDALGVEVEFPISDIMSIGVNFVGQAGRTDGGNIVFKVRQEDYQKAAYRLELAAKYYLSSHAPIGAYVQVNLSYGKLAFFDGTNRPFTMHSRWKKFNEGELRTPQEEEEIIPVSTGVGFGYQIIIIPKKIIGNIMVGAQGHLTSKTIYPAIYIAPSLGLMF